MREGSISRRPPFPEQLEEPEFRLDELDLVSGDTVASVDVPMFRGVGTFARHPEGDLLHFSVDGHQMIARRYSDLELVDETYLADDNPRVGYDGGRSAIALVDARLDDFTLLGASRGLEHPESSGDVERRWRKQYEYGTVQPIKVDYVLEEVDSTFFRAVTWDDADAIFRSDNAIHRVNSSGDVVATRGLTVPGILADAGDATVWRSLEPASLEHTDDVTALNIIPLSDISSGGVFWEDRHCSKRQPRAGGYVKDREEFVLVMGSGGQDDRVSFFHRISPTNGEVLQSTTFEHGDDPNYRARVIEVGERVGVVFYGSRYATSDPEAHAFLVFPFE